MSTFWASKLFQAHPVLCQLYCWYQPALPRTLISFSGRIVVKMQNLGAKIFVCITNPHMAQLEALPFKFHVKDTFWAFL